MKFKQLFLLLISLIFINCGNNANSEQFIKKATGRYYYNSDELIEVYFNNSQLFMEWRGAKSIQPLKVGDETFFVKEMNEKIKFLTNPEDGKDYIVLVPKQDSDTLFYNFKKLDLNEKIPSEYLKNNEFEKALEGYLAIKKKDSLDTAINENLFNRMGYNELRDKNYDKAIQIFKINIALYPYSDNVYDSYAEALMKNGDTLGAVENYKKSLKLDSGNSRAKRFIKKYDTKN